MNSHRANWIPLFAILLLSLFLNLYNNDFPLGYHIDEVTKVEFIQTDTQDFKHPILILQTVRFAQTIMSAETNQQVVELGRATSAIFGTLVVFLIYLIAKQHLSEPYALTVSGLTAISPGIVVHSHYLKEDIAFTFTILLSFVFFFRFSERVMSDGTSNTSPEKLPWRQIVLFGLAIGLLVSAKYKSGIVLFCFFIAPLYVVQLRKLAFYKGLFVSLIVGFFTFLIVNYPILFAPEIFIEGLLFELSHAMTGHEGIYVEPLSQLFTFHLRESLLPSITPIPIALAMIFLLFSVFFWQTLDWQEHFLMIFLVIFYFVLEASPLKPFPGFIRYVVPMIPVISYLCIRAIYQSARLIPTRMRQVYTLAIVMASLCLPFFSSVRLVSALTEDTRGQLESVLLKKQEPVARELYTDETFGNVKSLAELDLTAENPPLCTLVASSFMYDRYLFGSSLDEQGADVYTYSSAYKALFERPFEEVTPTFRSFAFSNPTLRIIDMCPDLWTSAESTRLGTFLDTLPGSLDTDIRIVSPSPSPIRPVDTKRNISLEATASYPNFLIIPQNEALYYALDNVPVETGYQNALIRPIVDASFEMVDATSLSFLQTVPQPESAAQDLAEVPVGWQNESGWTLLGYDSQQNAERLEVITYWRVDSLPDGYAERFLTRFYQLFNAEKQMLVNQGGAVGLWGYSVQVGDVLVERVTIPVSAEWVSGAYSLSFGLYDPIHNINFFFETEERPASYTFAVTIE